MQAFVLTGPGDIDCFSMEEVPAPQPRSNEIRIKVCYAGVNWGDIQKRQGIYPDPITYPAIIGLEVSGHVDAVGDEVRGLSIGQRVAAITGPRMLGGYAEQCVVPADYSMAILDDISLDLAAAIPTSSLTAKHLLNTAY